MAAGNGFGLRPVSFGMTGNSYNTGGFQEYPVTGSLADQIFAGDFVEMIADGTVSRQNGATGESPTIAKFSLGVAVGSRYVTAAGTPTWGQSYPGAGTETSAFVFVCNDPSQVYQIKCNAAVTQAAVGGNYLVTDFAEADGDTSTENSGINLDVSSFVTTVATPCLRIIDIPKDGKNEDSSTPIVLVRILPNILQNDYGQGVGI